MEVRARAKARGPTQKLPFIGWLKLALICDWSKLQKYSRHPNLVAMALFAPEPENLK